MRTVSVRVLLILFVLIGGGAANAQTTTATFPQKEEIIELGETWPDTPILSGLKTEIEKHWVQQGKFWFSRETSDGMIWQIGDVSCRLQPMGLTSPDRLNGIQWRGFVSFSWKAERFYLPSQEKWTRWKPGSVLSFGVYVEDGKSDFQKLNLLRHARTGKESELTKPEKVQIEAIIGKPKMAANESAKFFEAEFPTFSSEEWAKKGGTSPRVIFMPKPKYTEEARASKVTGKVVLSVEVLSDGSVGRISIVRSLGYGLDENAIMTVRQGRFSPATLEGKPVVANAKIEVSFNIP